MKSKVKYIVVFAILLCSGVSSRAQSVDYKAQVLFMYNFMKYTNWPTPVGDFRITVYGNSPIVAELKKLAMVKKTPNGKSIVVTEVMDARSITECEMLYIPDAKSKDLEEIINAIKDKPVLIITQRDGLVKKGACINFFIQDDDRLGFTVSIKNLEARKLKIGSELTILAEVVN